MIKCINHSFRSDGHCQCNRLRCTLLFCDPCVLLELQTVTHFKLTVPLLQKSLIHIMNTVRKRIEWWIQWRMKWTILMTFSKWTLWKKKDQTSNYCEFQAISNARLMSRICSDRLQNFIFVQWELVPDKAVKWSDPFPNSEKNGAAECVPAHKDKSSIKFGLLPRKGNKSKWHSTQIFFNT